MCRNHVTRISRLLLVPAAVAAFLVATPTASATKLLSRNTNNVAIKVDGKGRAVVYFTTGGRRYHPLVWGAINARPSSAYPTPQRTFKIDWSGGWGSFGHSIWKTIRNRCRRYDGPRLPLFVAGCKAPDGSYWALQEIRRLMPGYGIRPWKAKHRARELHISHWSGALPKLEVGLDWITSSARDYHELFGRFTYRGRPVHGYRSTSNGVPLDSYGRLLFLYTYNSRYGRGWKRENGFLARRPGGNFCYGFYPHDRPSWYPRNYNWPRPPGNGKAYKIFAQGPGVTPFVKWSGRGLPKYDRTNPAHVQRERAMNALRELFARRDTTGCHVD